MRPDSTLIQRAAERTGMEIREPEPEDADRIREVVESSMTTHYRLSPDQIDAIAVEQFSDDAIEHALEDDETMLAVAAVDVDGTERAIVGVVQGRLEEDQGVLRWLFVDPERVGQGIGTELFETGRDDLQGRGADDVRIGVLETNTVGHNFAEHLDYEQIGERRLEFADSRLAQHVYAPSETTTDDVIGGDADPNATATDESSFPETTQEDGELIATAADGERAFLAREETHSGTEGEFYVAYADGTFEEEFGFYCSNCGSLETTMSEMDSIECSNCGNHHSTKSGKVYDGSYL